jgi:colicin import membrane protein
MVSETPSVLSNAGSMHQKHPPAKTALAPEKPEPPQVIVPRPRVARLDIVGKQVQEKKLADAETERKLQEEDAIAKTEQERLQKEKDAVGAQAEQEKKQAEKLALDAEAAVRKLKEKDEAEAVRKLKEEKEVAAARAEQEKKQAEAEAARKQKEKEEAARKERERQRKEQEDRLKKMAIEPEVKDTLDDLRKRILKNADVEVTAVDTASNLVTKISDKYAASIQAAIRPNITFNPDSILGNPSVDIQVGLSLDGGIVMRTVTRSSGSAAWDAAALKALNKTERLPKDENGRVPPMMTITLRPRER